MRQLKFSVTLLIDAERKAFEEKLGEFTRTVTSKDTALVFCADHGITVNGESFLLPVDVPDYVEMADGTLRAQPADELIRMSSVLAPLQGAKLGNVFLYACRSGLQEGGRGLGLKVVGDGPAKRAVPIMRGTASTPIQPTPQHT